MGSALEHKVRRLERLAKTAAEGGPGCPACAGGPALAVDIARPDGTRDVPPRRKCDACGRDRPLLVIRIDRDRKPMQ